MYGEGVKATKVGITFPLGVSVYMQRVYFSDMYNHQVRYVDSDGLSHLVAGSPTLASGESGFFTLANDSLLMPSYAVMNPYNQDLLIAEYSRIRKVYFNATINDYNMITFAGGGSDSTSSGISALSAKLKEPRFILPLANGDVLICDTYNYIIRKISNGITTTIVGTGVKGNSPPGTKAIESNIGEAWSIDFHPITGEMYFSDFDANAIKYLSNNGSIYTYATSLGPKGIAFDSNGDLYVGEAAYFQIVKISNGVRTVIGNSAEITGFSGDGGNAINATFYAVTGIAKAGQQLYIADASNNRIRCIDLTTNIVRTVAGDGTEVFNGGFSGNSSTMALRRPMTTFYNNQTDELLIADTNNYRILRVNSVSNFKTSLIETIAGVAGNSKDDVEGKLAIETTLNVPTSVTQSESTGDVYIGTVNQILKVSKKDQRVSVLAGSSTLAGDNYKAISAQLSDPAGLAFGLNGDLYIADSINHAIRIIDHQTGIISTIAGNGQSGFRDGAAASAQFNTPMGLSVLPNADLLVADQKNNRIRKYLASSKQVITIAGGSTSGYSGDGQLSVNAVLNGPTGVVFNVSSGDIYIADSGNKVIRLISNCTGLISTIAGTGLSSYNGDGLSATSSNISPFGLSIHPISGELYFSDNVNYLVRRIGQNQNIYNVIGVSGSSTFSNASLANSTGLGSIGFLTFSPRGDLLVTCIALNVIKKMDFASVMVYNIVGSGLSVFNGDQTAQLTNLNQPLGVAYSPSSNELYFSDSKNLLVRKVSSSSSSAVETIAGGIGNKGPAINAKIKSVNVMRIFGDDLYFADSQFKIRKISLSNGIIDQVVGGYGTTFNGDNLANQTNIRLVNDLQIRNNEIVFADYTNNRIRKTSLSGMGMVSTIAGNGSLSSVLVDNIPATSVMLRYPGSVAFLSNGEMIIAERIGHIIRKVDLQGTVSLIAGSYLRNGLNGDSSDAKISLLNDPLGLTVLRDDSIVFVDKNNNRIRKLTPYCKDDGFYITQSSQGMVCSNATSCYGIIETDSKVCSGNGKCQSFNNCACKIGYTGIDCSIPNICSVLTLSYICNSPVLYTPETIISKASNITEFDSRVIELPSITISLPSTMSQYLEGIDASYRNDQFAILSSTSNEIKGHVETQHLVSPIVTSVVVNQYSEEQVPVQNIQDPISIYFHNLNVNDSNIENLNVSCMSFDETTKEWKSDGTTTRIMDKSVNKDALSVSLICDTNSLRSIVVIDQNYKKENNPTTTTVVTDNSSVLIGAIVGSIGGCCVLLSVLTIIIVALVMVFKRKKLNKVVE